MNSLDLKLVLEKFDTSYLRLKEALNADIHENELFLDATIRRYKFTFEICWKTLKRFLKKEGIESKSSREVFKEAFKLGWLTEGDLLWTQMIEDRNLSSHTYDQKIANEVYFRIKSYEPVYQRLITFLKNKLTH